MAKTKKTNFFTINNNEYVECYTCNINEEALKGIQGNIDNWNNKGELKTIEAHDITRNKGKFYEIISKTFLDIRSCGDGCCGFDDVKFYNIQYYEYEKHPLSIKCDELLKVESEIDLSYIIRHLIEWETENIQELQYQKQILQTMNIQKQNLDRDDARKIYDETLIAANPWLETSLSKINVLKELKKLFSYHEDIFSRNKIKKCLLKNLPFSSDIKNI